MPDSHSFAPSYDQPNPRERKMPNWKLQDTTVVWDEDAPDPEPDADDAVDERAGYDPSVHTIDEVKAFVEASPDHAAAVLEAELDGKNRVTLVEWLAAFED